RGFWIIHAESPTKRLFNDVLCGTATLARFVLPFNIYMIALSGLSRMIVEYQKGEILHFVQNDM
ncbi:MAG: hypothetical protein U9R58_15375, partial [Chloroflexota bacterium]|nr:hypothetical protein [Chloroflexota bacterium]